ncbi:MAG: 50S ribosomal protein L21 [Proteobacteria bacterium]|nr:50S ribosomal protein L21 [Pseudomonadota bacterium]
MYAVIVAGCRQFKVEQGQTLTIDRVPGNPGDNYKFDQVLMVGGETVKVGAPTVAGASVEATIKSQGKGEKIIVFKYKRRKNYKRTRGHRQPITVLEIKAIHA